MLTAVPVVSYVVLGSAFNDSVGIVSTEDRTLDSIARFSHNSNSAMGDFFQYVNTGHTQFARRYWSSWRRAEQALRAAVRTTSDREERLLLTELRATTAIARKWFDPRVRLRGKWSDLRVDAIGNWQVGQQLTAQLQDRTSDLSTVLESRRIDKSRADSASFHAASVVILGLSIATVVLVVARTIFGHRLIAQESRIAEEARESDEEHRSVVESSPDAIVVADVENRVTVANQSAADLFGFASASELIGLDMIEFVAPDERPRVLGARRRRLALEEPVGRNVQYRMKRRDGSEFHCAVSSAVLLNPEGHPRGMIRIIRDISERKQFELELIRQATHDDLTGLPNRALLRDRLDQALTMSRRLGTPGALLLMDLYRFKVVNDTFGHAIGDELLKLVGSRLQAVLRECDTVARLGGDEFAIHLANTDTDGTRRVATKVLTAMSEPFVVDNNEFLVDASLGAALYPTNGASVGELLRVADVAMYDAKSSGAGFTMYKTDIDDYDPKQMVVLTDLKKAIERDGLELYYQPKVRTYSGEVDSVEALARWHHPTRGDISPSEFIPLAEWTGLMMPLTKWVLRSALRQAKQWELEGHPMCVAVNLSASSLHDASLTDTLVGLLDEAGVSPSLLEIEVTETAVMSDLVRAAGVLQRLADLGITLSIDDFGTGYSSIAQLKRLPVSEIKIDRSFVHDISTDKDDMSIVRSLISLGHSLNLTVVAEGVEDGESVRILRKARCDMIQGFYYAKPMPANDLNQWLRARDSNTDATRGSRQVA